MNRRQLFGTLAAVSAVLGLPPGRYGLVDVKRWRVLKLYPDYRVWVNGVDITSDCRWFNDETGESEVLLRDAEGHAYVNDTRTGPASTVLHGTIDIRHV